MAVLNVQFVLPFLQLQKKKKKHFFCLSWQHYGSYHPRASPDRVFSVDKATHTDCPGLGGDNVWADHPGSRGYGSVTLSAVSTSIPELCATSCMGTGMADAWQCPLKWLNPRLLCLHRKSLNLPSVPDFLHRKHPSFPVPPQLALLLFFFFLLIWNKISDG